MIKSIIAIGLGSCIGGILRFLISRSSLNFYAGAFPLGTLTVNVAGCFAIGLISGLAAKGELANTTLRLFLTMGVCGGFTTFSTFMNEGLQLVKDERLLMFAAYLAASVAGGFALLVAGYAAARHL